MDIVIVFLKECASLKNFVRKSYTNQSKLNQSKVNQTNKLLTNIKPEIFVHINQRRISNI